MSGIPTDVFDICYPTERPPHFSRKSRPSDITSSLRPAHLSVTKNLPKPSESERLLELTRENGCLRQELARANEVLTSWTRLYVAFVEAYKLLRQAKRITQEALHAVSTKQMEDGKDLAHYWGVDVEKGTDIRII